MRRTNPKRAYTDGTVSIYREITSDGLSSAINAQSLDDLELVCCLRYNVKSCRQEDVEFASNIGLTLSLKLCVPLAPSVEGDMEAVIGNTLYHIYRADPDVHNRDMYIYLTEVRKL